MKKLLGIVTLGLLWINTSHAVSLPKDVASGSKFKKSLTGSYYKKYGMQVVDKKDGHPVRAGKINGKLPNMTTKILKIEEG